MEAMKQRKKNTRGINILIGIVIFMLVLGCGIYIYNRLSGVTRVCSNIILELGTEPSSDVHDYLSGYDFVLSRAVVDTGNVDSDCVGEYEVICSLGENKYTYKVTVADTTPPEIRQLPELPCYAVNREYSADEFVESVYDLSGEVDVEVSAGQGYGNTVSFNETGTCSMDIRAKDPSGNMSELRIWVEVDEPPYLVGISDKYIPAGQEYDLSECVVALDNLDGVITEKICIEGELDYNVAGDYPVTYKVSDSNGLETSKMATIHVGDIQETGLILSDEDRKILSEYGYFSYEPLEIPDYDETIKLVTPALVNISDAAGFGSGIIYKIDSDYVYFLTVAHVLVSENNTITFFDGAQIKDPCEYEYISNTNEIAMFRVESSRIPDKTLIRLKEIHIDTDIYERLADDEKLISYAVQYNKKENLAKKVSLMSREEAFVSFSENCIQTTHGVIKGMSGTATVDYRGNLVGIVDGYEINNTQGEKYDFCLKVDGISGLYNRVRGKNTVYFTN